MKNEHFGKKINILSNNIKWAFNEIAEKHGVTGVQARTLYFIVINGQNGEAFQKDIEREFKLKRSTVTNILHLIEEKGLVERIASKEDARIKKIKLTEKGRELQKLVSKEIIEYEKLLIKDIEEDKLSVFLQVLAKMSDNIGQKE